MNELYKQYIIEPHPWWKVAQYSGMDFYETAEQAERRGWHVIPAWGSKGWDLGSWPLVAVFFRNTKDKITDVESFQLAEYVEGDVTVYSCPNPEIREEICDQIAFYHWKMNEQTWIRNYETFEDLDDMYKGPYRR